MASASLTPNLASAGPPPVGFEAVRLVTDDAVAVAAWFALAANGAVIVMLHGAGRGRSLAAHAGMLARHGFGVLAVSARKCAQFRR